MQREREPSTGSSPPPPSAPPEARAWSTDLHVQRWQAGDEAAFEALYRRFAPLLARRVRRHPSWAFLQRRHQLDDVVQAVWERVVPAARRVFTPSGPGSFLAFLGTVADRTIVDLARFEGSAKRGEGAGEAELDGAALAPGEAGVPSGIESPTSHARASEIRELAERVLNARELEVWTLAEVDGYELEEVGLALGCTGAAARGVYFRARRKLVGALAPRSDGEA